MEKLKSQVNVTFWFWLMYPPPSNGKVEISGKCDILVLADVPPPPIMEKLKSQVNVTFWFWPMYPPPSNGKVEISGQCDILVLADVPPPPTVMEKLKSQVNMTFWFWLMISWAGQWTQTPSSTPLQPKK